jgi:hypothetical protein
MDNFSAFERKVDVADRLKNAIEYIERFQSWQIVAGRLSMNQATGITLEDAGVLPVLRSLCQAHNITIKAFSNNQKEIADHDLLMEIGARIGANEFQHIAVITNDAKAFTIPIERFPKIRFFIIVSDNEIGDKVRTRFAAYPNAEIFSFGFGRLTSQHQRRQQNQKTNIKRRTVNIQGSTTNQILETWPGLIPLPVQDFLMQLINICQVCGYRTLWSMNVPFCKHCGGGFKLTHLNCRPAGPNPLHPHRFLAVYKPKEYNSVAGLIVLPSHLQWQAGDKRVVGRYDYSQPSMIPIDDWLYWLSASDRKYLAREQVLFAPNPNKPMDEEEHVCWTQKENITLERDEQYFPLTTNKFLPLELGDYLHVGTKQYQLCVLHYLGLKRQRLSSSAVS